MNTISFFLKNKKLSNNHTPGHISRQNYNTIQKDTCIPMFTAALFTIAKTWKPPKCHQQING